METQYYLAGIESDVRQQSVVLFKHDINIYIIWPEVCTLIDMQLH